MATNIIMGSKLRNLRKDRGLSQIELARKIGISASYLNLIEHNRRRISDPVLAKLAAVLGVAPAILAAIHSLWGDFV